MRPIIKSRKHYVQMSLFTTDPVSVVNQLLIESVAVTAKNSPREVEEGAIVKAIYIELWLQTDGVQGTQVVTVSKQNESSLGPTFAEIQALDTYNNKKNVFYTTQGLTSNDNVSGPLVVLRGWIKIPRSKQRFGLGDILTLTIANPHALEDLLGCGFATYKEYT